MSLAEVVRLHSSGTCEVYVLGFLPGFAFLGDLSERLSRPRRRKPRLRARPAAWRRPKR